MEVRTDSRFRDDDGEVTAWVVVQAAVAKIKKAVRARGNEHAFSKPVVPTVHEVELPEMITVGDLAAKWP